MHSINCLISCELPALATGHMTSLQLNTIQHSSFSVL
uniref:Uncharacterized protein n=1 Tax=Anguilla anguilla TaxID=7936 RepID=A0A0E9UM89_ANGAN